VGAAALYKKRPCEVPRARVVGSAAKRASHSIKIFDSGEVKVL